MSRIVQRQNLANLITLSRLAFLPLIVLAGLLKQSEVFVALFAIQAGLDAVDGAVARRLHIESDLGRQLDTVIDMAIWLPSLVICIGLVWDEFRAAFASYPYLFIVPTITALLMYVAAYIFRHTLAAIHLYSGKLTGALVILLMVTMLLDRFYPLLGFLAAGAGIVYHVEAMAIYALKKDQVDENVTSFLQVFRIV